MSLVLGFKPPAVWRDDDGGRFSYSMPVVSNKKIWRLPGLGLALLLMSALLVGCGGTADTDYSLFLPSSLTAVTTADKNTEFTNAVLLTSRTDIVEQSVNVYQTTQSLADLQNTYNTEMTKRGWTNASTSILKSDELGSNGIVLAFEKALPDASKKRVIGLILLGPDANAKLLSAYRTDGTISKGSNIVIAIQGGTAPVPTAGAAATATPTK